MTRDDIIRMAREAGIIHPEMVDKTLERFAALIAAQEREACAKFVDDLGWTYSDQIAAAIRARGDTT